MNDLRINFTPKYLPILDLFKAKGDIRYYLNGVYVEKAPQGGVYLVATDGHTLVCIYDKDGLIEGAESAIVKIEPGLVAAAKKPLAQRVSAPTYAVMVRRNRAMLAIPDSEEELFLQAGKCLIEGKFPNWRKVLPSDFAKLKPGAFSDCVVNPLYMARFAEIKSDRRYAAIALWQEAPDKAIVVQAEGLPEAVFLVMPMKRDDFTGTFKNFMPAEERMPLAEAA